MHCYSFSQYDLFAEIFKMKYNNLYFWAKQWQIFPLSILLGLSYVRSTVQPVPVLAPVHVIFPELQMDAVV